LFNVLRAYARFNPAIGYTQGMSFVAGIALLETCEEEAFWILVELMNNHLQHTCIEEGVSQVVNQVNSIAPQLLQHLRLNNVFVDVFVHRWLATLFAYDLPLTIVVQVWDLLLVYGPELGICFAITLLQTISGTLLKLQGDELVRYLNSLPSTSVTPIAPLLSKAVRVYHAVKYKLIKATIHMGMYQIITIIDKLPII